MFFKKGDLVSTSGWCAGTGVVISVRKSRSYWQKNRQSLVVSMSTYTAPENKVHENMLRTDNRFVRLLTPAKEKTRNFKIKSPDGRKMALSIKRTK